MTPLVRNIVIGLATSVAGGFVVLDFMGQSRVFPTMWGWMTAASASLVSLLLNPVPLWAFLMLVGVLLVLKRDKGSVSSASEMNAGFRPDELQEQVLGCLAYAYPNIVLAMELQDRLGVSRSRLQAAIYEINKHNLIVSQNTGLDLQNAKLNSRGAHFVHEYGIEELNVYEK